MKPSSLRVAKLHLRASANLKSRLQAVEEELANELKSRRKRVMYEFRDEVLGDLGWALIQAITDKLRGFRTGRPQVQGRGQTIILPIVDTGTLTIRTGTPATHSKNVPWGFAYSLDFETPDKRNVSISRWRTADERLTPEKIKEIIARQVESFLGKV